MIDRTFPHPTRFTSFSQTLSQLGRLLLIFGAVVVVALLVWQGITAQGSPDPTAANTSPIVAALDIAVLVFREGLECVLVLTALTASMHGRQAGYKKPIAWGTVVGIVATILTWFIAVGIVSKLGESISALNLQAGTGLLAVVVLIIIMNWFLHKVYWGGWITMHNRQKRALLLEAGVDAEAEIGTKDRLIEGEKGTSTQFKVLWGLGVLGFASFYREGFEVVLFLQTYYLKMGGWIVLGGTALGLILTAVVAVLNFIAHKKLPYRKMLIFTGIMLGGVLLIMVGEQAQEMQLANWIPTTSIPILEPYMPDWMGLWFSVIPTVETLVAQGFAAMIVIGSYFAARYQARSVMV